MSVILVLSLILLACPSPEAESRVADVKDQLKSRLETLSEGESVTVDTVTFTVHKKAAGEPREDGWYEAVSTGCGFRVLLPGPFNDFSQSAPTDEGYVLEIHMVGTTTTEGARFTAMCLSRDDNNLPSDWIRQTMEGFTGALSRSESREIAVSGLSGLELRGSSPAGQHMTAWFLKGGQHAYQLMVEYPASEADYMPDLVDQYLSSFRPDSSK